MGPPQHSRRLLLQLLAGASLPVTAAEIPSRAKSIASSIAELNAECKANSKGDWQTYYASLRPFRQALWPRVKAALANPFKNPDKPLDTESLVDLFGRPGRYYNCLQLIEITADKDGGPLTLQELIDANPATEFIAKASQWLRQQGIELIFVPGPMPPSIEPEGLVKDASLLPAHGIVSPQGRSAILQLLLRDVEVVDALPAILQAKKTGAPGLIMVNETHWGPLSLRIAAELAAQRLRRLPLVRQSLAQPPRYTETYQPFDLFAAFARFLPPANRAPLLVHCKSGGLIVKERNGQQVQPQKKSSILVAGDSFLNYSFPPGANFAACLSKFINQPVSMLEIDGSKAQIFEEMARNPEILDGVKAVVWVMSHKGFAFPYNKGWPAKWTIPPAQRRVRTLSAK